MMDFVVGFWTLCIQTKSDVWRIYFWAYHPLWNKWIFNVDLNDSKSLDLCLLVFCAGWPFRWISLILTACPWWTMMHYDWLQYASRKRRESRSREDSSTARWTSTGPSYPLLKPAVLITLSLTLSSWHYCETENTRVIWVTQLNKSSVFKGVELRQYPNHGKITEMHSLSLHRLIENSCFYLHYY